MPARQRREFWAFGILNRSEADFHEDDLRRPYRGSLRGYVGPRSQIRDRYSDPII